MVFYFYVHFIRRSTAPLPAPHQHHADQSLAQLSPAQPGLLALATWVRSCCTASCPESDSICPAPHIAPALPTPPHALPQGFLRTLKPQSYLATVHLGVRSARLCWPGGWGGPRAARGLSRPFLTAPCPSPGRRAEPADSSSAPWRQRAH